MIRAVFVFFVIFLGSTLATTACRDSQAPAEPAPPAAAPPPTLAPETDPPLLPSIDPHRAEPSAHATSPEPTPDAAPAPGTHRPDLTHDVLIGDIGAPYPALAERVKRAFLHRRPALRRCYADARQEAPDLDTLLTVNLRIYPSGAVSDVQVVASQPSPAAFSACLQEIFGQWSFPHHRADEPEFITFTMAAKARLP